MPTLTWVGKDKVVNHHLDVPFRVLQRENHFDAPDGSPANSTDNRIIHGDNLTALKSLLPEFEGKINCIYIDPPYNTGNESWVYNDAVNDPKIKKWLGQVVGKEGEDLSRHDKWLCMMYPRLKLLHRLLAKDGVVFISIDDNEQANLKLICDEIFGINNFVSAIACINNPKGRSDDKYIATAHESILIYRKSSIFSMKGFKQEEKITKRYNKTDCSGNVYREIDLRKTGDEDTREKRPNMFYPFIFNEKTLEFFAWKLDKPTPTGFIEILPMKSAQIEGRWRWSFETSQENIGKLYAKYMPTKKQWSVFEKDFLDENRDVKPTSVWDFKDVNSERGTEVFIKNLGFNKNDFPNPKPIGTLERILQIATNKDALILDSFAGSGTTAHAVLKLNAQDQGNRRFILIEMEDYADTITAERVRRVMAGFGEGTKQSAGLGGSFDYYTIGAAIFNADDTLNEAVGVAVIRDYVSYSEGIAAEHRTSQDNAYTPYLLGLNSETAWVFYYELEAVTCLDLDFLGTLKFGRDKPATAIIYADKCLFNKEFLTKHGIIFKKIPRDITRF